MIHLVVFHSSRQTEHYLAVVPRSRYLEIPPPPEYPSIIWCFLRPARQATVSNVPVDAKW